MAWVGHRFSIGFFDRASTPGAAARCSVSPLVYRPVVKPPEIGRIEDRILFSQAVLLGAEDFGDFLQTHPFSIGYNAPIARGGFESFRSFLKLPTFKNLWLVEDPAPIRMDR